MFDTLPEADVLEVMSFFNSSVNNLLPVAVGIFSLIAGIFLIPKLINKFLR
jgi:hypothetical protein